MEAHNATARDQLGQRAILLHGSHDHCSHDHQVPSREGSASTYLVCLILQLGRVVGTYRPIMLILAISRVPQNQQTQHSWLRQSQQGCCLPLKSQTLFSNRAPEGRRSSLACFRKLSDSQECRGPGRQLHRTGCLIRATCMAYCL